MSIATRIESMYDHVEEVYDTITNVELPEDKNIENIPNTIKDSYLKIMNEGYQEIWDNWDKREASGTETSIDGTEEAPMSLTYKGNTYQYTADIAGKNLFNFNSTSRTHFGTLTINNDTLTLAGGGDAAQVWWGIDVSNYTGNITISYSELTGATMHESDNKLSYCFMSSIPTNWNNMGTLTDVDKTNKYATTALGGGNYLILVLQAGAGNAYVDGWASVSEVQVELGSTPTSYERFAGATPTPSLPSPIQVVSGDNSIEVCGRNLAYTGWAENFVTRINNSNQATLETFDNRNCLKWKEQAGYGDYDNKYMFKINWKENTQYTFSFDLYTTSTNNFGNICIEYTDGTITEINEIANTWAHKTTTSTSGKTIKYLRPVWRTGYSYIDLDTFMVYEGTETLPYEEYKSASYPISLGLENLFPSGLTQRDTTSVYTSSIPVMPNTTYSIDTSLSNLRIFNIYQDADKNTITNSNWMNIPTTFTTINGCYYLQIVIGKSDSSAITTSEVEGKIDLTKGTTPQRITDNPIELCKIGTYQDKIDKSTGKNLFDKSAILENKLISSTGAINDSTGGFVSDYIFLKGGTTYYNNTRGYSNAGFYDLNKTFIERADLIQNATYTPSNDCYVRLNGKLENINTYQFEVGTSSSEYEPYGTDWYLKKEIGKVVLDGTEYWGEYTTQIGGYRTYTDTVKIGLSGSFQYEFYCDYFDHVAYANVNNIGITMYALYLNIDSSVANTIAGLKTWLSTHKPTIWYPLSTPTYETITDTTLIGQLEALKKSYEGQTNISQINNDLPFELDVVALSDGTASTLGFSLGNPLSSSQPEEEEPVEEEGE